MHWRRTDCRNRNRLCRHHFGATRGARKTMIMEQAEAQATDSLLMQEDVRRYPAGMLRSRAWADRPWSVIRRRVANKVPARADGHSDRPRTLDVASCFSRGREHGMARLNMSMRSGN